VGQLPGGGEGGLQAGGQLPVLGGLALLLEAEGEIFACLGAGFLRYKLVQFCGERVMCLPSCRPQP
jgi:hypothetical protein